MAKNNEITIYTDDITCKQIEKYQELHQLTKSKAVGRLVRAGLVMENKTVLDSIYWELAKITGTAGLVILMLYNLESALSLPLYWYGLILIIASFVSMAFDHVDFSITRVFNRGDDPDDSRVKA